MFAITRLCHVSDCSTFLARVFLSLALAVALSCSHQLDEEGTIWDPLPPGGTVGGLCLLRKAWSLQQNPEVLGSRTDCCHHPGKAWE